MSKNKFLQYLEYEKKYSTLTILSYKRDLTDLEEFLLQTDGEENLTKVNKRQLRNFIIHLSQQKLSERTINRKISSIRSYCRYLLKIGEVQNNAASDLQNLKIKKHVLVPYTEEEINLLQQNLNNQADESLTEFENKRNQLIFEVFYQTGIRRIELIHLKDTQVDVTNKTINVIGKRNKERQIPITEKLTLEIKEYIEIKNKEIGVDTTYFFCKKDKESLPEKFVYKLINNYLSTVTTKNKKSPHMLRHTFASHLLTNGAEINSIKEILGHSSLAATQVYTHTNIENLKKVFNQSHPFGQKKEEK